MANVIRVGIGDWKLCTSPDTITTIGLGSCVGIVIYTQTDKFCGLLHIMLPSSKEIANNSNRAKFADTGLVDMIKALEKQGMKRSLMKAKIAGGAKMFQFTGKSDLGSVGDRNVTAVKKILNIIKIPIVAEDCGKDYGRTVIFNNETKQLTVKCAGQPDKNI
ncbi:MAG: chemotaxis protein CheD [Lachnospiraceae bacterium]|jgi:chemotaxis protein CheD|nr:chemotaxis protein CheD [Lachnospiraceae bacterium]